MSSSIQRVVEKNLLFNPLTHNDPCRGRTAPLTSEVAFYIFIQQIYVLNILNMVSTLRFYSLQNAVCFIILTYLVHILCTECAKIKKKIRRQKIKGISLALPSKFYLAFTRAGVRGGPVGQLPGAPTYKGQHDAAGAIGNVMPVNPIFQTLRPRIWRVCVFSRNFI